MPRANTGASDLRTASSFLAYFALVWWIWASQVAYNTRFRTRDWIHRIFSGTQFIIFCAMATFTSNFDIFQGIIRKEVPAPVGPVDFQLNNTSFDSVFSLNLREAQLPVINDKGIAVTMGCSRLLLFLQYLIVFTTAPSHPKSLRLHLITLLLSSITYFASIAFIGDHPSETSSILKICFWFAPMMLEIISHFAIARIKDHEYNSKSVAKRSATLFIVVLGEGLNQITGSFKYVVGAVGFTGRGLVIMLSAGVIIIGELSLYCRHNWRVDRCGPRRTLLWFFSHYLLMASLILTLQAVRYLLSFANLYSAITTLLAMADDIADKTYFGSVKSVTAGMFPDAENAFIDLGLPFDSFIGIVNTVLANPLNGTARTHLAQTLIYVASVTFNEFDAFPSPGSPLFNQTQTFLEAPFVDPNSVFTLLGDLITSRLQSAFWFWGVAGGSLIILASMSLMLRKPADKYETIGIIARFVFGAAFLGLTGLTVGHNVPYFANAASATTHLVVTRKPWNVASAAWV
ncbi:hypothetical protein BD779DRAFT_913545 [Infundibulicybe gibba]|nr:hypothetical protein BD779DRAFT_913545 [Infundibulicybe gibba]